MLSTLRKLLENWIARAFFGLLIIIFVFWGISNVLSLVGSNTAVAHIAGKPVDIALVQAAYQSGLTNAQQSNPSPDLATRQQIAAGAIADVLRDQTIQLEEQALGVVAPPASIRQMIYAIPAFQTNGAFDRAKFNQVLAANNTTPDRFLGEVKSNLTNRQLIVPIISGVNPPADLISQIFDYVAQQRIAETVTVATAAQPVPAPPAQAMLIRYWQNHPAQFTAPEYRTVKLVILSPALLAPRESVSAAEITAAYARATAGQSATPQRSLQVVTVADKKQAQKIAAAWRANAAWTNIQQRTTSTKGTAVELDNAQAAQIPDATLSAAAFAAPVGAVTGPVQGPFGWLVLKVLNAGTSLPSLASMQDQLTRQLQLQKAQAEVAQDVDNLQDALAGNTPLDQLPGNLGLIAVEGTLDAGGNAQDGTPAPIPGGADLKAAIVKAVFAAQLHDPAQLTNGPNGSYFAFTLDTITPPALKPYDQVKDQVLAAWTGDAVSREAQVQAAALYHAASTGQSLDDAASAAGLGVAMSAPITRNAPPAGILGQMVPILFSLKLNEATMAPAPGGFIVASLAKIIQPSANDDPADFQQVQASMAKAMQDDVAGSFITGLQSRDKVTINQKLFAQIYQ